MDAQSEQIIRDIQDKRERLGENLAELEIKVRDATNWRTYFNRNPWMMIGASAAAGFLLSAILVPSRHRY
jgi:ElaB/YqjD/DUF883 family membrane-anchored ribosome-binding protein